MGADAGRQRSTLRRIAHWAMIERGLLPDFPGAVHAELDWESTKYSARLR